MTLQCEPKQHLLTCCKTSDHTQSRHRHLICSTCLISATLLACVQHFCLCWYKPTGWLKPLLHVWQINDRQSACTSSCLHRCDAFVNPLSHVWQINERWPVCISSCAHRCDAFINPLSHVWQINERRPVCISSCARRFDAWANALSHVVHMNGRLMPILIFVTPLTYIWSLIGM